MDTIDQIRPEERIPHKGFIVLPLEAVNMTRPRPHRQTDWALVSQLVPASFTGFRIEWRSSCVDVRMWNLWSSSLPASSLDRQSCPMYRRTWIIIARYWAFAGPEEDGGIKIGESPV